MKIRDITFIEYVSLDLDSKIVYDYYLEYGKHKAVDHFGIGAFVDASFGFVKDLQYYFNSTQEGFTWDDFFKEMSIFTGRGVHDLQHMSIFTLMEVVKYITDQVSIINNMEANYLGYAPDANEVRAGIDKFSEYGGFVQFDSLAQGDLLRYDAIKKLPYSICFTKLKLEVDRSTYQKNLNVK